MGKKVLIVGTVPYNEKMTSRAFDAYFHYWNKDDLAQIFSNQKEPLKGHCGTLYQITDSMILRRWFKKNSKVGKIYNYDDLRTDYTEETKNDSTGLIHSFYKFGSAHNCFTHLLRGILWRKKFWHSEELDNWLENFKPECVFLAFSDDYFINDIALYVSNKFNIPIVPCIGDDYYFNEKFSINPFYIIYKKTYKKLIRKIFKKCINGAFISDKIRDKYNSEFNLSGETVYLTSTIKRKTFKKVSLDKPLITYFGNICMGRNFSLCDVADCLYNINNNYKIEVYSNEIDNKVYDVLKNHKNVIYGGSIPYKQVKEKMHSSDITIIVEGFKEKDVNLSRYSLSTKAADALASGCLIITYGSQECGIVEYMKSTNASIVSDNKNDLEKQIRYVLSNEKIQKEYYDNQIEITKNHHNLKKSTDTVLKLINDAIEGRK